MKFAIVNIHHFSYFVWDEWQIFLTICAFFGHSGSFPIERVESCLEDVVSQLILEEGVDEFWLCEQLGSFDYISRMVVTKLRNKFNWISLYIALAYNPTMFTWKWIDENEYNFLHPDEVMKGHPKFAIVRRNEYIAKHADIIVCYITRDFGGAYKAVEKAKKYGKKIINIADYIFKQLLKMQYDLQFWQCV